MRHQKENGKKSKEGDCRTGEEFLIPKVGPKNYF